jgi:6-phosphogluconolactonase
MVGTMKNPRIIAIPNKEQFYDSATAFIVDHFQATGTSGQRTTLFLSGGSTPGTIYTRLSNANLDWANIDIAQVDDRWVGLDDPGSNAKMIKQTLLKKRAKAADFYRIMSRHKTAKAGQSSVEARYRKLTIKGSIAVLGMGPDGHVCSWFPGAVGLEASVDPANDNRVQAIAANPSKVTGPYLERMTLTLSALVQCEALLLLITGEEKMRVLQAAINDRACELPVRHLINAVGDRLTVMSAE